MKAISTSKYGSPDVLELVEIPIPEPKEDEILIKIKAASVTTADTMMRMGKPIYGRLFLGLSKPKHPITGTGFSGVIEAIGKNVDHFQVGDHVFGESTFGQGTNAEFLCIPQNGVVLRKPKNISFKEAATICDGTLTSWNFLKELGRVKEGHHVLINGASGSLGTAAVQLARHFGAEVTGVCSTTNLELVRSLGAQNVIDYTKTDFTSSATKYDIIFDTIGKRSFSDSKKALKENGLYLSPVLSLPLLFQMLTTSFIGGKKAKFSATGVLPIPKLIAMLKEITELLENNNLKVVIDKTYSLEEVPMVHRYVEIGRKKGNVVISL